MLEVKSGGDGPFPCGTDGASPGAKAKSQRGIAAGQVMAVKGALSFICYWLRRLILYWLRHHHLRPTLYFALWHWLSRGQLRVGCSRRKVGMQHP